MTYAFITYSFEGMRGVQARGVRIAEHLPRKEVVFLNSGNADWLNNAGYRVIDTPFDRVTRLDDIRFPRNTKAAIFCDIPTNRPYQTLLFIAAREQKIPTVVVENIYHRSQPEDPVYRAIIQHSDLFLFNGLSCLWRNRKHQPGVDLIPPLIAQPKLSRQEAHQVICAKYDIPEDHRIVLASGYKEDVKRILDRLVREVGKRVPKVSFVVIASSKRYHRKGNVHHTPVLSEEPIRQLLLASNVLVCKKGFLQVLEALSLGTPVVCIGRHEGFFNHWIDPQILRVMPYFPQYEKKLVDQVVMLLKPSAKRTAWGRRIKALHDGQLDGARRAADHIKKVRYKPISLRPKLLLSLNRGPEVTAAQKLIRKDRDLLPLFVSVPYLTLDSIWLSSIDGQRHDRHIDFDDLVPTEDILKYGANQVMHTGQHDMHGWALMLPWVDAQHKQIQELAARAKEIVVVGSGTASYLADLLKPYRRRVKVIPVRRRSS